MASVNDDLQWIRIHYGPREMFLVNQSHYFDSGSYDVQK